VDNHEVLVEVLGSPEALLSGAHIMYDDSVYEDAMRNNALIDEVI
jgi:hypothetical protein